MRKMTCNLRHLMGLRHPVPVFELQPEYNSISRALVFLSKKIISHSCFDIFLSSFVWIYGMRYITLTLMYAHTQPLADRHTLIDAYTPFSRSFLLSGTFLRECVAVCCSVLQCVAVHYTALRCVARVAACCSVLQRVAMCWRVLQWVIVCCSVLQSVAVCCSVLQ